MITRNSKFDQFARCHFGGGGAPKPPPPPKPPMPTDAAKNVSDRNAASRRRNGFGYRDTILTGGLGVPGTPSKTLLGD